jgi:hypothetical protein
MKKDGLLASDQNESQKSKANRLETPEIVFYNIIDQLKPLGISPPTLDVFASLYNSRCIDCITVEQDAFTTEFLLPDGKTPDTIWINAPHNIYKDSLIRIHQQYLKHDFNAIILIPSTNIRTSYWYDIVEKNRIDVSPNGYCFYYPYNKAIYFELDKQVMLKDGIKQHAHNAYNVLLFVKKSNLKSFKDNLTRLYRQ